MVVSVKLEGDQNLSLGLEIYKYYYTGSTVQPANLRVSDTQAPKIALTSTITILVHVGVVFEPHAISLSIAIISYFHSQ